MKDQTIREQFIATFETILTRHKGFTTPVEEFILDAVENYQFGFLSPHNGPMLDGWNTFRSNFSEALATAKQLMQAEPSLFEAEADAFYEALQKIRANRPFRTLKSELQQASQPAQPVQRPQLPTKKAASSKGRKAA